MTLKTTCFRKNPKYCIMQSIYVASPSIYKIIINNLMLKTTKMLHCIKMNNLLGHH